jgi:hypothetical protein
MLISGTPSTDAIENLIIDPNNSTNLKALTGSFLSLTSGVSANPRLFTGTYNPGFYVLRFRTPANLLRTTVKFHSDPYPCPFPNNYVDIFHSFPGCTAHPAQVPTFPCITLTNGVCTNCYFGYALVNITCIFNPCNNGEYYLNLTCLKADPSCLDFDRFSGVCRTCINSNYALLNGACIVNACPDGQTNRNNTCVSNYCNSFSSISGVCLSCINNAFELNNGSCVPFKCFAPNLYFSFSVQSCISLPVYCK